MATIEISEAEILKSIFFKILLEAHRRMVMEGVSSEYAGYSEDGRRPLQISKDSKEIFACLDTYVRVGHLFR